VAPSCPANAVEDEVGRADKIEGCNEQPEERPYPNCEQRRNGQDSGGEIAIGGGDGKAGWQAGADHARNDEDQPEETRAVQGGDHTMCGDAVHRLEPGQDISAKAKQPNGIAEQQLGLENGLRRHGLANLLTARPI